MACKCLVIEFILLFLCCLNILQYYASEQYLLSLVTKFMEGWNLLSTLLPLELVVIVLPPEGCLFDFVLPCYPFFAIVETQLNQLKIAGVSKWCCTLLVNLYVRICESRTGI